MRDSRKVKREFRVPLSPRCIEILHEAQKISDGNPYVFPSFRRGRPRWNVALIALMQRYMGLNYTVHGFRSRFRD